METRADIIREEKHAWEDEMATTTDNNRQQVLNDMRSLIDWLEAHPAVNLPYDFHSGMMLAGYDTRDELVMLAQEFGTCQKDFSEDSFSLRKKFGVVQVYAFTSRQQVCERVVVGSELVPEHVTPAYVRDVVEWHCSEPLLANGDSHE